MEWLTQLLGGDVLRPPTDWNEKIADARSYSGYLREEAVRALAAAGHGAALPVLLERVNDWVPQVRAAAREGIAAFLRDEHIASWGPALGQVAALGRATRDDHAPLLHQITTFLG